MTKTEARTKNSVRNAGFATFNFVISLIMKFALRTVFLYKLSEEYLGLDSLFSNILQLLSLAELGIGSSIVYSMYKPVAENDLGKVRALNNLYRKIYFIIGAVVTAVGLSLTPFLHVFIKDTPNVDVNLYLVYIIYIFNTSVGYFFAFRRSLIYAYQRNDIETKVKTATLFSMNALQIVTLLLTSNYYVYISLLPVFTLIDAVTVFILSYKMFPAIRGGKEKLDKASRKEIIKNASAMLLHKLGSVAVFGTDNIIISAFLGLTILGRYNNYYLIITGLTSGLNLVVNAIKSSIGNLIATSDSEKVYSRFKALNLLNFTLVGFCTICCFNLFQPFIALWLGQNRVLDFTVMALICVSFYLKQNRAMTNAFKECAGLFWNDRFRPLFEAGLNLGGSILLVMWIGLPGVILGTIISTVLAPLWCEPYMVYKHYFKKNVLWYFVRYAIYSAVTVAAGAVTFFLCSLLPAYGFWSFIAKMAISIFGTLLIYFLAYFKTPEFKYIASSAKRLLLHKKKKVPAEKSSNGSLSLENKGSPVYGQTEKPEDDETSGGEKTKTTDGTKQQIPIEAIPDDTPYLTNTDAPDNEPSALPAPEEKDIGGG